MTIYEELGMTEEYGRLSLRFGLVVSAICEHLDDLAFVQVARFHAFSLTRELLFQLESASMVLGVPWEVIAAAEDAAELVTLFEVRR